MYDSPSSVVCVVVLNEVNLKLKTGFSSSFGRHAVSSNFALNLSALRFSLICRRIS